MAACLVLWGVIVLLPAGRAWAVDEEGCLFCHGLDMASRASEPDGRDLCVREPVGGPHDALFCSDCHPDARRAPHASEPGAAQCIGDCHGQTASAKDSHRRASYGGLSESHRGLSSPQAPCRLCHRAADKAGSRATIAERCAGCHPGERSSEIRGVHARFGGPRGVRLCAACHVAHPAGSAAATATCTGPGCHQTATVRMNRLAGHRGGAARGRASAAAVLVGLAGLGWIVGRRLSPPLRSGGEPR